MLSPEICRKARLSRDPRFDGRFFIAVKTTGIYCRPICPVISPKEKNVTYYASAIEAAKLGYRPCLRCRPDSAPGSSAWKGVNATLERAIRLISEGALQEESLSRLAERLGISDRYLRQLFNKYLGVSPKAFALYQQCLFAKQLLHQTKLPITQVALASGFNSVRRFNDCFQSQLKLTPSQVRKSDRVESNILHLKLYYRPPYDWSYVQSFFMVRAVTNLEWGDKESYGRTFEYSGSRGYFTARHIPSEHAFKLAIELDDITQLKAIVSNVRRLLDLDVDVHAVEYDLQQSFKDLIPLRSGLRLPGTWNLFEAGIRAILGQQVSVAAARDLIGTLVDTLGEEVGHLKLFPSPRAIAHSELGCLKIPKSRKQSLRDFARHYLHDSHPDDPERWQSLKGVGPWTVNYARMRGQSDPDIYLAGDLGIKKVERKISPVFNPALASPWRSYLTLQLWSQL